MNSAIHRARRFLAAALVTAVAGASLLFAAPAQAYDIPDFEVPTAAQAPVPYVSRAVDAAGVVRLWKTAGPATRAAAAVALAGGPDAVQAFVDAGQDAPLAADRKQLVTEVSQRGSKHVRSKAQEILAANDPALIDGFLASGWESTWNVDLRTVATYFTEYKNVLVQREAQKSLDAGQKAVRDFVLSGWMTEARVSDRQAAYALIASPNPAVSAGAKTVLATSDPDSDAAKVADYLRYGQFVAAGHYTEFSTVSGLLKQVKADIKDNPLGSAAVADRAQAAVVTARGAAITARDADEKRLLADWKFLTAQAAPRQVADNNTMADQKPLKEAFSKAAKEVPGVLAVVSAPGADLDALIKEARLATVDLALVGTPEVKKAAETALASGDAAVKNFIAGGHGAADKLDGAVMLNEKQRVAQLHDAGGEYVRKAASIAGKSPNHADTRYFLEYGYADAQELDNRILAYQTMDDAGLELRAAANVALDGSRADAQVFATAGQFAALERDNATTEHIASVDAMLTELAGLADKAKLDAGQAAAAAAEAARAAEQARRDAEARAAEEARQAEAARAAEAAKGSGTVSASQEYGNGQVPNVVPWPREYAPAVEVPDSEPAPESATESPVPAPSISVPPASADNDASADGSPTVDSESQEAAAPLAASATGVNGWTIGLIVLLVLAAAGAITFLLRRKGSPAKS
ncbi:ALF repeat-containing protein [Paenarthrobacter ilicis]|uniref:ALF repeat-containing protein n=1 Tax=Paenarthrobacter ilicis TaxID=43665 RepID=UPI0028D6A7D4|nr:ALF repeat-containing protein [Paenarthrobacter ilicis]